MRLIFFVSVKLYERPDTHIKDMPMIKAGSGFHMHESLEMNGLQIANSLDKALKMPTTWLLIFVGYNSLVINPMHVYPASMHIIDNR